MGVSSGVGAPVAIGLLALAEAAVPVGVPADVLMLVVGERAAAGAISPLVAAVGLEAAVVAGTCALFLALRGPGRAVLVRFGRRIGLTEVRLDRAGRLIESRGPRGIALGRATPGLRTLTVVAVSGAGLPARRALLPLLVGSSIFVQAHFVLGYLAGPAVLDLLHRAAPVVFGAALVLLVAALLAWVHRRGRGGAGAWAEAGCPLCVVLGPAGDRLLGEPRPSPSASP